MSGVTAPPTAHKEDSTAPNAKRVGWKFIALYVAAWTGVWMALLPPVLVGLGLRVRAIDPENATADLSLVMGVGALIAMFGNPLFGHLSDRTTLRFGMRRPWLIFGAIAGACGLATIACATSVWQVLLGWCVTQLAYNAELAALMAILPDQVPERQRGLVSGAAGMGLPIGMVGGTFLVWALADSTLAAFLVPAAIAIATAICLAWVLPDRRLERAALPSGSNPQTPQRTVAGNPLRYPDFAWAWASRFLLFMGIACLLTYQGFYLIQQLAVPVADVPRLIFISALVQCAALTAASFIGGSGSDALGRRKIFLFAAGMIYALALVVIAAAPSFVWFLFGRLLSGIGEGMYSGAGNALVADVLPERERDAGRNLGIFNMAAALPQSLAPAVAPSILLAAGGSYAALFFAAAAFAAAAALAILRVRGVR
jgi:MFS family permease